jgi:hypothetical protein
MSAIRVLALCAAVLLLAATGPLTGPGDAGGRQVRVGQAAPEITGGPWINSEALSMAALRGRVVMVEFWTYG